MSFHSRVNCYIVPKIKDDVAYGDGMDWFPSPVVPATALAALVPQAGRYHGLPRGHLPGDYCSLNYWMSATNVHAKARPCMSGAVAMGAG